LPAGPISEPDAPPAECPILLPSGVAGIIAGRNALHMVRYLAARLLTLAMIVGLLTAATDGGPAQFSSASAQTEATPEAAAPTGGVEIVLSGADGSGLAGGCFAAIDTGGVTLTGCDDDGDGVTRIDGLAAGTAAVVETTVPVGFTGAPDGTVQIVPGEIARIGFSNAPVVTPEPPPSPTVEPSPTATPADTPTPVGTPAVETSSVDGPAGAGHQSLVQAESVTGQLAVTTIDERGGVLFYTCFKVYTDAGGGARGPLVAAHCDQDDGQKDGRLLFDGLDALSYILVQTSAPTNFTRAADTPFLIMAGQTTSLTIQDQPGGFVGVTTVDGAGQPLPGACYRAYVALDSGKRGAYVGSGCDGANADGLATIRSLPFGEYVLGQSVAPSGYAIAPDQTFSIIDQSEASITVHQSLPGILAISTIDPDLQAPIPGACFRVYKDAGGGARGSYVVSGCDGDDGSADGTRIFADLTPGPYVLTESSAPAGYAPALNRSFSITPDQTTAVTLENRPASELVVVALGDQQQAVAGDCFKVYTDNGTGKRGTFVTSRCDNGDGTSDGTTHVPNLALNSYVLVDFTPPAGYTAVTDQPFTIVAGRTASLTIQHQSGGEAAISLVDASNHLLPGGCFTAYLQPSGAVVGRRCDRDDGASDGRTAFVGLAPGTYRLRETTVPSGVAIAPPQNIIIVAGQVTPVTLQSAAGGSVFVSMVDEASQPIPGGCVSVSSGGKQVSLADGRWAAACDGDDHHLDGKIAVSGLAAGTYSLEETKAPTGYLPNTQSRGFSLTAGTDVRLTLSHQLGGSVTITLIDEHQQALPGSCFSATYDTGGSVPGGTVTGYACDKDDGANDGKINIIGQDTGNYVLVEKSLPPGYLGVQQPVAIVVGQHIDITIQAQVAGRAIVTLIDERNLPIPNACYTVYADAGGGTRGSAVGVSRCDSSDGIRDGVTVLDYLPSGSYVLATKPNVLYYVIPDRPFTIQAGSDTPINIQSQAGGVIIVTTVDSSGARVVGACYDLYDYYYVPDDGGYTTLMASACDADDGLDGVTTFRAVPHAPDKYLLNQGTTPPGYISPNNPPLFNLSPRQTIRLTVQERSSPS
jgi:uncharacterized surface anchored protein